EDRDRDRRPQSRDRADRGPRAPRRDFGDRDRAPRGDRPSFRDDRPARSDFGPREDRPARSEFAPRTDRAPRGDRPAFRDDRAPRGDRPSFRDDRAPRGDRPSFRDDRAPRREFADRAPRGDRPEGGSVGRDGGPTATVSFFNEAKGYGFAIDREGQELFIHSSQIMDRNLRGLRKGQKVTVDVAKGPKGLEARNVRVLESRGSRF
ncbi:MAG: cold shock domain-containing protein, partial [Actinomycetes bacterium]